MQKWVRTHTGKHFELGIAENNLFLMLSAAGLAAPLFGARVLPVGTLYDPFVNRGLDSLFYACYQDSRFMVVGTPSGITLAPEGGAHQSVGTPLVGIGLDRLAYFEPAFVDELASIMAWGFRFMQADDGGSVYLRLSTRQIAQPTREMTDTLHDQICRGGYWLCPPAPGAELAVVYAGAIAPEAMEAHEALLDDVPGAGLLAITSPDRLHEDWMRARREREQGRNVRSHIEELLSVMDPRAALVTVLDGHPATLSRIGSVGRQRVAPLGVESYGQSGTSPISTRPSASTLIPSSMRPRRPVSRGCRGGLDSLQHRVGAVGRASPASPPLRGSSRSGWPYLAPRYPVLCREKV